MLDLSVSWLRSLAFAVTQGLNSRFAGRKPAVILIGFGLHLLTYALFGGLMSSAMSRGTICQEKPKRSTTQGSAR